MPLTLVTGPANAGKAGRVLGAYRDRIAEEPVLVVPAMRDVRHSQRELASRGAVFGTRVVRFRWLFRTAADRFFGELGRSSVEPQRLWQALRAWAHDGPKSAYAEELGALYAAYRKA